MRLRRLAANSVCDHPDSWGIEVAESSRTPLARARTVKRILLNFVFSTSVRPKLDVSNAKQIVD